MVKSTVFVSELSQKQVLKIKKLVSLYCLSQGFDKSKSKEIINNIMSDRLCLLEEIGIDTDKILLDNNDEILNDSSRFQDL